jgi:hypothetical protein
LATDRLEEDGAKEIYNLSTERKRERGKRQTKNKGRRKKGRAEDDCKGDI